MSLSRLLNEQQARMDQLIHLMEQEQKQLTQGDIDGNALAVLAEEKQTLLAELDKKESMRRDIQQRLGYPAGHEGAKQAALDANCPNDWQSLVIKGERVARMNELTGQMLALRMKHNQQMLDYIRQIAEKTLYKPDGRNSAQPGRINASA